jgi:hypothetical protein
MNFCLLKPGTVIQCRMILYFTETRNLCLIRNSWFTVTIQSPGSHRRNMWFVFHRIFDLERSRVKLDETEVSTQHLRDLSASCTTPLHRSKLRSIWYNICSPIGPQISNLHFHWRKYSHFMWFTKFKPQFSEFLMFKWRIKHSKRKVTSRNVVCNTGIRFILDITCQICNSSISEFFPGERERFFRVLHLATFLLSQYFS